MNYEELVSDFAQCTRTILELVEDQAARGAPETALTSRALVLSALNPELKRAGYPPIQIRIGLEAGEGLVDIVGDPGTKRTHTLVGDFLDMSVKLQGVAPPGGICVGYILERNLHVTWRRQLTKLDPAPGWNYVEERGNQFRIYAI
jgi:class 3 adenylate cyclase